jgi:hypothetical protein
MLGRRRWPFKDAHKQRPDICTTCHLGIRWLEVLAEPRALDERAQQRRHLWGSASLRPHLVACAAHQSHPGWPATSNASTSRRGRFVRHLSATGYLHEHLERWDTLGYPRGAAETTVLISPLVDPLGSLAIAGTPPRFSALDRTGALFTVRMLECHYGKDAARTAYDKLSGAKPAAT